jgi:hypothetical protein
MPQNRSSQSTATAVNAKKNQIGLFASAAETAAAANAAQNKYQNEYVARPADFVAEAVSASATQEQNKYPDPTVSAILAAAASSVIVKHSFYLLFRLRLLKMSSKKNRFILQ